MFIGLQGTTILRSIHLTCLGLPFICHGADIFEKHLFLIYVEFNLLVDDNINITIYYMYKNVKTQIQIG